MNINADRARDIGVACVNDMIGEPAETYTFKRSKQVKTMNENILQLKWPERK